MTSVEDFNCILCKETFENKDELQIHFRKHGDPKFNESIKTKSRLQNEAPFANEKSNDASEMVNCDVCEEVFPTISKAITHKHKVHPEHDAKYFCPWCGKLFTMKHLYNKHLHTNHDTTEETVQENKDTHFHCDSCDVNFFLPSAMVYHNKFFHRQDADLPIIGHSKKQKLVNQDLLPVYYCSFCGEEYINKVNLHKHMCDDHGDENQRPTDVMRCPLCEAVLYHLDAYELHLTFHSSEDLYSETNEMNEKEMIEYSLETVPPVMERIEDLNNLPDVETDVNAVGIESFLQMAMDESKDGDQLPEKARTKKHKKHKKSKKSAITLDEFLSMNQDVFGEDLDFQGIEEVPTKLITKQLKIKKQPISKSGAKVVSSADLQKLKKLGIAVKVKSGNKPPVSQVKPIGQPIKVSPQVKNLGIQTKTHAISASNDVLSKLLNQSSSQLKIVKKSTQEKEGESHASELIMENVKNKTETAPESIIMNSDENSENSDIHKSNITEISDSHKSPLRKQDSDVKDNFRSITDNNDETANKQSAKVSSNIINNACIKQIHSPVANQNVSATSTMSSTLKNIGKQITIKPVTQSAALVEETTDKLVPPEVNEADIKRDEIFTNNVMIAEENEAQTKNNAIDTLKNLNSSITIKSLKNSGVNGPNKIITTSNDRTEKISKQGTSHNAESIPIQQSTLESTTENAYKGEKIKEQSVHLSSPSHMLKHIRNNITIKPTSPQIKQAKEDMTGNQHHDTNKFNNRQDDVPVEKNVSTVPDKIRNLNSGLKFNSDIKIKSTIQSPCTNKKTVVNVKEYATDDQTSAKDNDCKSTYVQSSDNILKQLTNITAKPVPTTKVVSQEIVRQSSNKAIHVMKEGNAIKKSIKKEFSKEDIEIFNIEDSDDEEEPPKRHTIESTHLKKEPIKANINSHKVLDAIKNMSKHITVKPTNNQMTLNESPQSGANVTEQCYNEDEMHDDGDYDSNDDFGKYPKAAVNNKSIHTQKDTINRNDPFNNVLRQLGKHITVKSRNASPNQSTNYLKHASLHLHQETAAYDSESDEDTYPGKVKITEVTEDEYDTDHINNCNNEGIVTQSHEDSFSDDEEFTEDMEETDECHSEKSNVKLNQNIKPSNEGLLKNISKNITVKSVGEQPCDTEDKTCRTTLPENESIGNQTKYCKELSIKPFKQIKPDVTNDSEKTRTSNIPNTKQMGSTNISSPSSPIVHPKLAKSGVVNTVNKEVKLKTFQSETVIEEITTTVTKTIRRVNQTVTNQQVVNANQMSSTPKMIKPQTGHRLGGIHSNLKGVTVRQATPVTVRPKIRQPVPFRPTSSMIVRPSNHLVAIRPGVTPIRATNPPRMQIKNMPRQQTPVGRPLKISPNVVNQTMKRSANEEGPGHFSCFKKPKESLIPGNETTLDPSSSFKYTSSSQMSKFCSTTQTVKGKSVVTSTQMKAECSSQQQQLNRLCNISGLKVAKSSQVTKVEKTETNASRRTTQEAIEKLQKQGLLIKKPRIEEDFDPPNFDEDNDQSNEEYDE